MRRINLPTNGVKKTVSFKKPLMQLHKNVLGEDIFINTQFFQYTANTLKYGPFYTLSQNNILCPHLFSSQNERNNKKGILFDRPPFDPLDIFNSFDQMSSIY